MRSRPPRRVLFAHTPKAAGVHLIEYFSRELGYPRVQSTDETDDGVWRDYTINSLRDQIDVPEAFLHSHVLAHGWSGLVEIIPPATRDEIVQVVRDFRDRGWFTFTVVRHPGELLCSFYHYVLDAHQRGWHAAVAKHAPVLGVTLDEFVAEHCDRELLPDYWREFDFAAEASDATFKEFFRSHFDHEYMPGVAPAHASGSRGYAYYCESGELSAQTQARVRSSRNYAIYLEIVGAERAGSAP